MGTDGEFETVPVKTYVPAYQRAEWERHAEALGMNRSEFVRTMVQAGRRSFEATGEDRDGGGDRSPDADPGGESLEDRVLDVLDDRGPLTLDGLVAALTDDVEARAKDLLTELQEENRIGHRPGEGYVAEES